MYFIANFKQNKSLAETLEWVKNYDFETLKSCRDVVVMCPTTPFADNAYELAKTISPSVVGEKFFIGVQNLSDSDNGAHTGETGATQIKDFVKFAIIGHSERRKHGESNEQVLNKILQCQKAGIIPIVCFSDIFEVEYIKLGLQSLEGILFAYEPLFAIGSGTPASPENITDVFKKSGLNSMIYGGSVDLEVAKSLKELSFLSGFLVGGFSLDPLTFSKLLKI